MKLKVLGSGSILSSAKRNCSSYLLKADGEKFVFDFGTGAFKTLQKNGESYLSVNNFFFTHFDHPDHVNDFVSLVAARYVARHFKTAKPNALDVVAPNGFKKFFKKLQGIYLFLKDLSFKVNVREVSNSSFRFKNLKVVSRRVAHTKTSVGYRVSLGEKSFAYSGDTGYCKEIVDLCSKADLAILECSLRDSSKPIVHLNALTCGKIAREAGAKSLLLTHIYPYLEKQNLKKQAGKEFSGKILVACDGMVLSI